MSHMEGISDDSSITDINNEHQVDFQPKPPALAKTLSADSDIHGVLVSKADPKKNELAGKPPNHLNEQEPEGEVHGALDLVAILSGIVGLENLIDIVLRQVAFLWNQEGCSHHRHRTPEYVPKVEEIIEKLSRGYRLDDIIFAEKDLVFLRQLLEHILDSEIISSSLESRMNNSEEWKPQLQRISKLKSSELGCKEYDHGKHQSENVSTSRPDAVLEALKAAPCHSRATANLPAHISEEDP